MRASKCNLSASAVKSFGNKSNNWKPILVQQWNSAYCANLPRKWSRFNTQQWQDSFFQQVLLWGYSKPIKCVLEIIVNFQGRRGCKEANWLYTIFTPSPEIREHLTFYNQTTQCKYPEGQLIWKGKQTTVYFYWQINLWKLVMTMIYEWVEDYFAVPAENI